MIGDVADDLEAPGSRAVGLQGVGREGNPIAEVPAVLLARIRGDQRPVAGLLQRRQILRQYLEQRRYGVHPHVARGQCQREHRLGRLLIGAEEAIRERHLLHAGERLQAIEVGHRQRRSAEIGGPDEQQIRARLGDGLIHARLQSLQDTEQGEGHRDLQENQGRAPGLAPDARPDEGEVFHP